MWLRWLTLAFSPSIFVSLNYFSIFCFCPSLYSPTLTVTFICLSILVVTFSVCGKWVCVCVILSVCPLQVSSDSLQYWGFAFIKKRDRKRWRDAESETRQTWKGVTKGEKGGNMNTDGERRDGTEKRDGWAGNRRGLQGPSNLYSILCSTSILSFPVLCPTPNW